MEVAYIEQDPKSAPHPVEHQSQPPFLYLPDHNEKYPVHPTYPTQPPTGEPWQPADPPVTGIKRKWPWVLAIVAFSVAIIVAAVVGGVVGSRQSQSKNSQSQNANPVSSSSSPSTITDTPSSTSGTPTSSSSITTTTSADTSLTTVAMYQDGQCGGRRDSYTFKPNTSGCQAVPADKRAILVRSNQGCNITTWSSDNCGSNPFLVPDSECHSILYAAISYSC